MERCIVRRNGPEPDSNEELAERFVPNTVETITPGFFDSKPTSGVSTSDRAKGDEADYDSGQYKEWTEKCAAAKKKSMELFRECFNEEKVEVSIEEFSRKPVSKSKLGTDAF